MKSTKGITLVSLVITVVVLIILSAVAIRLATDENGIFGRAKEAVSKWNDKVAEEEQALQEIEAIFNEINGDYPGSSSGGSTGDNTGDTTVAVTGVSLSASNITLATGASEAVTASISPSNASNKNITWTSSDTSVATVNNAGRITAVKAGTTTITVTTEDGGKTATCEVTVLQNEANAPILVAGMSAIKFTIPDGDTVGGVVNTTESDEDWYNYEEKRWANAKTEDESMWVWIPRYAYRINKSTQTTEVVFLIDDTNNYYDANGNLQTAKRCTGTTDPIDTTTGFTVHPAFTNESSINYRNGGWDDELTGIWVAKFEAGYATGNNSARVASSSVKYSQDTVWARAVENGTSADNSVSARNWLDGIYGAKNTTAIKYPTFQPLTYSMNYINHNDAFLLAKDMTGSNNIYGFTSATADTHLMKDSEWGAVAYFSQSQYGLNGTDIAINNVSMNSGGSSTTRAAGNAYASVYGITGVTRGSTTAGEYQVKSYAEVTAKATNNNATTTDSVYKWNQIDGQKASSSGNIYGIYDLSGALWERTAAYVANGHSNISTYGASVAAATGTKYAMTYSSSETSGATLDEASAQNYANSNNQLKYGNNMHETSTAGTGSTSWYGDYSYFPGLGRPFSIRGGGLWDGQGAGLFCFSRSGGYSHCSNGFRPVVVAL